MFYTIARILGPKVCRFLLWLSIALLLLWMAGQLNMWGAVMVQRGEEWVAAHGFAPLLVQLKTRYAIIQLEWEIDRLQKLQAEAEAAGVASAQELAALAERHSALQAEILLLAAGLEGGALFDPATGRVLSNAELRAQAEATLLEFNHVEAQQEIYAESQALQQGAALRAEQMQREAAQSIATLQAHLALVTAQALWQGATGEENLSTAQLQAELEYARRLAAERATLAGDLSLTELLPANPPALPATRPSPMPAWRRSCASRVEELSSSRGVQLTLCDG